MEDDGFEPTTSALQRRNVAGHLQAFVGSKNVMTKV